MPRDAAEGALMTGAGPAEQAEELDQEFSAWYRRQHPALLAAMLVVAGDLDTAQEVTAEAFARAYPRYRRLRSQGVPNAWVYRVGLNVLRRRLRRAAVERHLLARQPPSPPLPAVELDPELWQAVRALPARQRQALVLRYVGDFTESQVGLVMGISAGAVAATLHAARRRLSSQLASDEALKGVKPS